MSVDVLFRSVEVLIKVKSFFFTLKSKDIFEMIYEYMNQLGENEQAALTYIWRNNINGVNNRYKPMNITYNIGIYHIPQNLKIAELPVKVAHFHPHKPRHLALFHEIIPERLMKIFNRYGIS